MAFSSELSDVAANTGGQTYTAPTGVFTTSVPVSGFPSDAFAITFSTWYKNNGNESTGQIMEGKRSAFAVIELFDEQHPIDPASAICDPATLLFRLRVNFGLEAKLGSAPGNFDRNGFVNAHFNYSETARVDYVDGISVSEAESNRFAVDGDASETCAADNQRLQTAAASQSYLEGAGTVLIPSEFRINRTSRLYRMWLQPRSYILRCQYNVFDIYDLSPRGVTDFQLMPFLVNAHRGFLGANKTFTYGGASASMRRVQPKVGGTLNGAGIPYGIHTLSNSVGIDGVMADQIQDNFADWQLNLQPLGSASAIADTAGWFDTTGALHLAARRFQLTPPSLEWLDKGFREYIAAKNRADLASAPPPHWTEMIVFSNPHYRCFDACDLSEGGAAAVGSYVEGTNREVHFKLKKADGTWPADDEVIKVATDLVSPASVAVWQDAKGNMFVLYMEYFNESGVQSVTAHYVYSADGGKTWAEAIGAPI